MVVRGEVRNRAQNVRYMNEYIDIVSTVLPSMGRKFIAGFMLNTVCDDNDAVHEALLLIDPAIRRVVGGVGFRYFAPIR